MKFNAIEKRIFESILRENGSRKITTEMELLKALAAKKTVYAKGFGPFGEDYDNKVVAFGDIEDLADMLKVDKDVLNDMDYDSKKDMIEDHIGLPVIIVSKNIGQTSSNFFIIDNGKYGGCSIEDCNLYT